MIRMTLSDFLLVMAICGCEPLSLTGKNLERAMRAKFERCPTNLQATTEISTHPGVRNRLGILEGVYAVERCRHTLYGDHQQTMKTQGTPDFGYTVKLHCKT